MPFQSEKQRRYLWANEPEIARDWTDTYGSRIRKDNGGIMDMASDGNLIHDFQNYTNGGENVSVPRSFQARPQSDQVNLAYITPREEGILQNLKPGTPHRGPMEVPNYDSFDAAGGYTSGAAMSAAETGSRNQRDRAEVRASNIGGPKGLAPGVTSNQAQELRNASIAAGAMGQRGSGFNFNPLSIIGGAFGNVGRGIGFLLGKGKDWAGKMRGGINPKTGRYYTQQEYEDERSERIRNKRIQNILGRKAPVTEMTQRNLGKLGHTGEMPGIGSTGTSRAIDKDYTMQDTLREYPITTNRIQDIQKGWNNQVPTRGPMGDPMWDNRGINGLVNNYNPKDTGTWFDTHPATGEAVMTPGMKEMYTKLMEGQYPDLYNELNPVNIEDSYAYTDIGTPGSPGQISMHPYSYNSNQSPLANEVLSDQDISGIRGYSAEVTRPQYNMLKSLGQVGNTGGSVDEIKGMVPAGTFDSITDDEWEMIFKGEPFKAFG